MSKKKVNVLVSQLILLITIPLIIFSQVSLWQSITHTQKVSATISRRLARTWADRANERLDEISRGLNNYVYGHMDFAEYSAEGSNLSNHLLYLSGMDACDQLLFNFPELSAISLHHVQTGQSLQRYADSSFSGYAQRHAIKEHLDQAQGAQAFEHGWVPLEINGVAYLQKAYLFKGVVCISLAVLEQFHPKQEENIVPLFVDEHSRALTQTGFAQSEQLIQDNKGQAYHVTGGGYLVVSEPLVQAPLRLLVATAHSGFLDVITPLQYGLIFFSLLCLLWPLVGHRSLKRLILQPLQSLADAMMQAEFNEAHLVPITQEYKILELNDLRVCFNNMMQKISGLRIEAYEKELEKKQVELQYLHLQIRPHFYLNCLKGIYAGINSGYTKEAADMTLAISEHLRYMFTSNVQFVTLGEELRHALNYIKIRQMNTAHPIACNEQVDLALWPVDILPFSILTFVENAIKHRYIQGNSLMINIRISLLKTGKGTFVNAVVSNNGGGFSKESLYILNAPLTNIHAQSHVGLSNIRARLQLMYEDQAVISFYNEGDQAIVDMIWPYSVTKQKDDMDECTDCR